MKSQPEIEISQTGNILKKELDLSEFNYFLPEGRIAQYPVNERDMSKLLISGNNFIKESFFRNLDEYIPSGHMLVFNNTRVVRARINFEKTTGASIEVFCIEPLIPADYERSFSSQDSVTWKCIIGNLKKWKRGKLVKQFIHKDDTYELTAEKQEPMGDAFQISFRWNCRDITFAEVLEITGHIPLPPYINREDKEEDKERYQTIYAQIKGSVAAPTAGLHFSDLVLARLRKKGIKLSEVTLHVGAGTFQPLKTEHITEHDMHSEQFTINIETIENILENSGRIIAVGTTSVRTLESLYWIGNKISKNDFEEEKQICVGQWEPYTSKPKLTPVESLMVIQKYMDKTGITSLHASTRIMIIPGYTFRIINGIITNFHQPGSTLLLLISAWTGDKWKKIYDYALNNDFRFLSYGDCSLLFR